MGPTVTGSHWGQQLDKIKEEIGCLCGYPEQPVITNFVEERLKVTLQGSSQSLIVRGPVLLCEGDYFTSVHCMGGGILTPLSEASGSGLCQREDTGWDRL